MGASPSDAERELEELRGRAHDSTRTTSGADLPGPAADSTPAVGSVEGQPRSLWQRLTATRGRRSALVAGVLIAGALVAVPAIVNAAASLVGPHPDATLSPVADEADGLVRSLLGFLGANTEASTIRGYEPYRGFEPWYFEEKQGFQCFMIVDRTTQSVDGANCVPPGVDLFADIGAWPDLGSDYMEGLPDGSIIRFHYREDSVDVFVYPASEAD